MVGVIAVMATSFKRAYASRPCLPGVLYLVTLTSWQATVDPLFHQRLDTHRRLWLSLFWGHFSFFLGPGAQQVLFVTSKSLFPQSTLLGFSFILGCGVSCFWWYPTFSCQCSVISCNFGVLTGEDEHTSFYSTILKTTSCGCF